MEVLSPINDAVHLLYIQVKLMESFKNLRLVVIEIQPDKTLRTIFSFFKIQTYELELLSPNYDVVVNAC